MKNTPRVGVVGAGSLGFHHIRILRDLPGIEFSGFVESRAERRTEVEKELRVRSHVTLDGLLEASDAVVIVVPTSSHFAVASAAIERGQHVFIEKPITTTLEEADILLDLARKKGVMVQIGHIERFNRAVRAALPHVNSPRFIDSERLAPFSPRGSGVAVVLDLMIHDIDLLLTLVGSEARTRIARVWLAKKPRKRRALPRDMPAPASTRAMCRPRPLHPLPARPTTTMSAKHVALAMGAQTSGSSGRPRLWARRKVSGPTAME